MPARLALVLSRKVGRWWSKEMRGSVGHPVDTPTSDDVVRVEREDEVDPNETLINLNGDNDEYV
jgi:hypothetical protein